MDSLNLSILGLFSWMYSTAAEWNPAVNYTAAAAATTDLSSAETAGTTFRTADSCDEGAAGNQQQPGTEAAERSAGGEGSLLTEDHRTSIQVQRLL